MLVVEGEVVGDAAGGGVQVGATQLLGTHLLARGRLNQRWPAQEDGARAPHDDRLIGHGRHICSTGGRAAHHQSDLRDPSRGELRLVVKDSAEVLTVREDLVLERQEGTSGVDEIEARQAVLERDLLGPKVLLDRHREVGAALDRGVVGDQHALNALDHRDPGHDARSRRVAVVEAVRGERRKLEECTPRVDQALDAFADGKLSALAVAGDARVVARRPPVSDGASACPQLVDQPSHGLRVDAKRV